MAATSFRKSFKGFNREDVVQYIQYLRSQHEAELAQLKTENQHLQDKLQAMEDLPSPEEIDQLKQQLEELQAHCAELEAQLQEAQQSQPEENLAEKELAAYRRAEQAERIAKERAGMIYNRANGILAETTVQVDSAATHLGEVADRVNAQLAALQNAVLGSKESLSAAAAVLASIRPDITEE